MKTFEIEVVRTYTTTIEIEVLDHLMASDIKRITMYNNVLEEEEDIYDEIWEQIGEAELEQMDVDMLSVKAKERKSGKQLFDELGFTSEKG
jgi:hypothetical protein